MLDLSSRKDLAQLAEDLAPLTRQASTLGMQWILFGAQARDLVLETAGLRPVGRSTLDVDVAVEVGTWGEYENLRDALVTKEAASLDQNVPHRLRLKNQAALDIVPFGSIETDGVIAWPPHGDVVLQVLGLMDAQQTATTAILPSGLRIRLPSLPVYTSLKLLAWNGRHVEGVQRDATDLAGILNGLDELISLQALYADHATAMEASGYDPAYACAQILGQRMATELSGPTRQAVSEILAAEIDPDGQLKLVQQLSLGTSGLRILEALTRGFTAVNT